MKYKLRKVSNIYQTMEDTKKVGVGMFESVGKIPGYAYLFAEMTEEQAKKFRELGWKVEEAK